MDDDLSFLLKFQIIVAWNTMALAGVVLLLSVVLTVTIGPISSYRHSKDNSLYLNVVSVRFKSHHYRYGRISTTGTGSPKKKKKKRSGVKWIKRETD